MGSPESGRMIVWSPRAWRAKERSPGFMHQITVLCMRHNDIEFKLTSRGSEAGGGDNSGGKRKEGEAHSDQTFSRQNQARRGVKRGKKWDERTGSLTLLSR